MKINKSIIFKLVNGLASWLLFVTCLLGSFFQGAVYAQTTVVKQYTFDYPHSTGLAPNESDLQPDPATILLSAQSATGSGYCIVDADPSNPNVAATTGTGNSMRYEDWVGTCTQVNPPYTLCDKLLSATTNSTSAAFYHGSFYAARVELQPLANGATYYPEKEILETTFLVQQGGRYAVSLDVKDLIFTTPDVISSDLYQPVVPVDVRVEIQGTTLAQAPTAIYESSAPAGAQGEHLQLTFTAPSTTPVVLVVYVRRNIMGYGAQNVSSNVATLGFCGLDNLNITYTPPPSAPVVDDVTVCGTVATLSVNNPVANATYNWYTTSSGGSPVYTSTSSSYPLVVTAYGTTTYYVSVSTGIGTSARTPVNVTRRQVPNRLDSYTFDYPSPPVVGAGPLIAAGPSLNPAWTAGNTTATGPAHCIVDASGQPVVPTSSGNSVRYVEDWLSACATPSSTPPPASGSLCYNMQQANATLPANDPFRGSFLALRVRLEKLAFGGNTLLRSPVTLLEHSMPAQAGGHYVIELDVRDLAAYGMDSISSGWNAQPVAFTDVWAVVEGTGLRVDPTAVYTYDVQHAIHGGHLRIEFDIPNARPNNNTFLLVVYAQRHHIASGEHPAEWINPDKVTQGFVGIDNLTLSYPSCDWPSPTVANVQLCGQGNTTLRATYNWPSPNSALPTGTSFQWYSKDASGTYTPVTATTNTTTESTLVVASAASAALPQYLTYYVSVAGGGFESNKVAVTATFKSPSTLTVTAGKLCPGTTAAVTLSVDNATPASVDYFWYDTNSTASPSPYPSSAVFAPVVSGPRTYYVQAVPKSGSTPSGSNNGCPSTLIAVPISLQSVVQPSVSLPAIIATGNALSLTVSGDPTYTYSWDWRDPNPAQPSTSTGMTASHTYQQPGTYTLRITYTDRSTPTNCVAYVEYQLTVSDMLCELMLPAINLASVTVMLDNKTGSYLVGLPGCVQTTTAFACLTGPAKQGLGEVVAASAMSLTSALPAADPVYQVTAAQLAANPFLVGGGRLLPEASYAYAAFVPELTPGTAPGAPAGTLEYARSTVRGRFRLTPFNWQVNASFRPAAWRRAGLATRYAPDGQALEEQDILRIPSTVKLGYAGQVLPYLTAKNARYGQVLFESFERVPNRRQGEGGFEFNSAEAQGDATQAHAGNGCLQLVTTGSNPRTLTLPTFTGSWSGDVQLKLWVRVSEAATPAQALSKETILAQGTSTAPALTVEWVSGQSRAPLSVVAQTGDWLLCEATLANASIPVAGFTPKFYCTGAGTRTVWVDDVRLQPLTAQMSAYVYDWSTLKLLASFDDQHFGLYYQYNAEGKLVRKQVETERGLKTIQETQYNLPQP